MTITEIIQNVATGSAVALGITYILGGLIVNLNLARRGIVEFQVLKVKYLVAGLIFILQAFGAHILAFAIGIVAVVYEVPSAWYQTINIISMILAGSLILAWARLPSNTTSFFASWTYWLTAATIGAVFPALIFIQYELMRQPMDISAIVFAAQAVLTGLLTLIGQIYHYAAFYYGKRSTVFASLDPIGVGIHSRIRIACARENIPLFKSLGINFDKRQVTQELFLIDETDHSYILAFEEVPHQNQIPGTLKVDKSLVKAMLYTADMGEAE